MRELLLALVNDAIEGRLLSVTVIMETTSGQMATRRTTLHSPFAVAGYMDAVKYDITAESFFDEEYSDSDSMLVEVMMDEEVDDDEDEDEEED
jgi:hypothetical protein